MFWLSVLHVPLYNTVFLDFWFRPPKAQNLLPQICTKSPISRLVWQIDRRCLGLPEGFRGWPIQWNHPKCCGADPCCHGNEIWARHGDPVAYRLVFFPLSILILTSRCIVITKIVENKKKTKMNCCICVHNRITWLTLVNVSVSLEVQIGLLYVNTTLYVEKYHVGYHKP